MSLDSQYPFFIRLYNQLFSSKTIDYKKLIKSAQKSIGQMDFGTDDYEIRLKRLCEAINAEAKLHPWGVFICKERIKGILKNRLRAVEYMNQHPEVLNETIQPPIIIAGLQRTGTTFLQRLLAADTDNRALLSWEALNPIPFKGKNEHQKRINQAKLSQRILKYMSPVFFSIHPVEYGSPEEDILLNDMTLISAIPEATMHVPSFAEWVTNQDHSISYDWLIKMLQILQWKKPPQTWVLKTPQHLEYMGVIATKFPKATIIQTHRHPKECIPSFCSMVYHSRKVFSEAVDPLEVAHHWLNKNVFMLQQMLKARAEQPNLKVIDIYYKDLIKNPIAVVQNIYKQIERPWDERVEQEILGATQRNKKDKYGKHQYDKADFGLTDEGIEELFGFYLERFFSE